MRKIIISLLLFLLGVLSSIAQPVKMSIANKTPLNQNIPFNLGTAVNPRGETVTINSQSMLMNGKPVIPVMGEIHFSRLPEGEWEKELLKMKAGGINMIATYIFWIHHEEIENKYDWSGQRNLRKFIEACNKFDLPLVLRIGPWAHGECRNGGFPEWLVKNGIKLRNDNPEYLTKVKSWYQQIFNQAKGLLWKDGGPVIGIQLENEYRGRWEHLMTLKTMASEIGLDVPLYTRTGWPKLSTPAKFGEIIPLYGDYADGFWDRTLDEMPGDYSKVYTFRSFRNSTVIATEQLPKQSDKDNPEDFGYPFFTCELGGGMMPSYHRRINIAPMDIYAMALVKIGSGSNLPGYYMYHGGTNPDAQLTTLNEEQATSFTNHNDLPVKTYDFQAPLGEFGQVNPHYHLLRRLHLFLHDFGEGLAQMSPDFATEVPATDSTSLRWCVRSNGVNGYVFVNNYQRLKNSNEKNNIRFAIDLPEEKLFFPEKPLTVPANSSFFIPFNQQLGNALLKYATAQPIAKLSDGNATTFFFSKIEGISADFVFDNKGLTIESAVVKPLKLRGKIYLRDVKTSKSAAIQLRDSKDKKINIVLLDDKTSLHFWKGHLAGKDYAFISKSELTINNREVELTDTNSKMSISVFPVVNELKHGNTKLKATREGIFSKFEMSAKKLPPILVQLKKISEPGPLREIKNGGAKVAESPKDAAFNAAAVWQITLSANIGKERDIFIRIPYTGDVARVYANNKLLTDNFYNGKPFEIGLKRFSKDVYSNELTVKILPLQKDAPIYIQKNVAPDFGERSSLVSLPRVEIFEKYTIKLSL